MKVGSICANILVCAFLLGSDLMSTDLTRMVVSARANEIQRIVHSSGIVLVRTVVVKRLEPPYRMPHSHNKVGIGPVSRVVLQSPIRLGVLGTFETDLDPSLTVCRDAVYAVIHLDQTRRIVERQSAKLVVVEIEFFSTFEISHEI